MTFRSIFKSLVRLILLLVIICPITSCKKSTPVGPEELKPGRRDYTWTVDTLDTPYNQINRMWGDSYDNVWAVASAGDMDKVLWHFDGNKWNRFDIIPGFMPTSIFGFSKTNIWVGGVWGKLWHYNGSSWNMAAELKIKNYESIDIEDIRGDSPDNIYAVGIAFADSGKGYCAAFFHYNGNIWALVDIPETRANFVTIRKDSKGSGIYFIQAIKTQTGVLDSTKIFTFDGKDLKEIYTGLADNSLQHSDISEIDGRIYINIGYKIYKYQNNKLEQWKDFSGTNYLARAWGRNENDIFYTTNDLNYGIGHFNGTDLAKIYPGFMTNDAIILNNSAFFETFDFSLGKNLILRGILN